MNITEYKLTITCEIAGENGEREKELIYRENQNVIITEEHKFREVESAEEPYDGKTRILFPRHILQKFMEMINE